MKALKNFKSKVGKALTTGDAVDFNGKWQLDQGEYFSEPTPEETREIKRILDSDNYFEVLEVDPAADLDEQENIVGSSYLAKAQVLSPNEVNHPQRDEAFDKLAAAYDTLSDPRTRAYHAQEKCGIPVPQALLTEEDRMARRIQENGPLGLLGTLLGLGNGSARMPNRTPGGNGFTLVRIDQNGNAVPVMTRQPMLIRGPGPANFPPMLTHIMPFDDDDDDDENMLGAGPITIFQRRADSSSRLNQNQTSMTDARELRDRRLRRRTQIDLDGQNDDIHDRAFSGPLVMPPNSSAAAQAQAAGEDDNDTDSDPGIDLADLLGGLRLFAPPNAAERQAAASGNGAVRRIPRTRLPSRPGAAVNRPPAGPANIFGDMLRAMFEQDMQAAEQQRQMVRASQETSQNQGQRAVAPRRSRVPMQRNRYADELAQLDTMGFHDVALNSRALELVGGDVNAAVDLLLQS